MMSLMIRIEILQKKIYQDLVLFESFDIKEADSELAQHPRRNTLGCQSTTASR